MCASCLLVLTSGALFALGAIMIGITHRLRGTDAAGRKLDWVKYGVYLGLISLLLAVGAAGRLYALLLYASIAAGGTAELYDLLRDPLISDRRRLSAASRMRAAVLAGLFFLALAGLLGHLLVGPRQSWRASYSLVLLLVAATDSYSQLWGKLLGRHRLCGRLSPGKTVEGFFGGILSASVLAPVLGFLVPSASAYALVLLGFVTALAAAAGDLCFSLLKRRMGTKDFSNLIPGHGGLLDRFDSLILAAPVFYWIRPLLLH
jgi:phosphatidate cytidylyltransferase